jgi:hypothetical protein
MLQLSILFSAPSTPTGFGGSVKLFVLGLLFVAAAATARAQTLVVERNTNLRTGPSTEYQVLELLHAGDTVLQLEPQNIGGYIQVRHLTNDGWLWKPNVHAVAENEVALALPPAPAHHKPCPVGGTPGGSARQSHTDSLKNRTQNPADSDIDPSVALTKLRHSGDDTDRFKENAAGELIAYVERVKPGGKETVNCGSDFDEDYDTHIELSSKPNSPSTKRVIVEITPPIRELARQRGQDWTTDTLISESEHKWIRARGWMLWDWHHTGQAMNTKPHGSHNWRATAWELHPVTEFTVCPAGQNSC